MQVGLLEQLHEFALSLFGLLLLLCSLDFRLLSDIGLKAGPSLRGRKQQVARVEHDL